MLVYIYAHSNTDMQEQAAKIMDNLTTPIAFEVEKTKRNSSEIKPDLEELHQIASKKASVKYFRINKLLY